MAEKTDIERLKQALSFSLGAIASEHFFSAGMSSPWSTAKFARTEDDHRQVWRLFESGTIASLVFAGAVGFFLKDFDAVIAGVLGAGAVAAYMYYEYDEALSGNL